MPSQMDPQTTFLQSFLPPGIPGGHALLFDWDGAFEFQPKPLQLQEMMRAFSELLQGLVQRVEPPWSILEVSELSLAALSRASDEARGALPKALRVQLQAQIEIIEAQPPACLLRGCDAYKRLRSIHDMISNLPPPTPAPLASLQLLNHPGPEILIPEGVHHLGRAPQNSIQLRHPTISRRHCCFRASWPSEDSSASLKIWDLGSSCGIYINGRLLRGGQALVVNDLLRLGSLMLKLGELAVRAPEIA